ARLAHERHRLALADVPRHAVHRADDSRLGMELGSETPDVEVDLHQAASLPHRPRRSAGAPRGPLLDTRQGGTERIAVLYPARFEASPEPSRPLPRRAVGPGLGRDAAAGLLLDAIVAHRG